MGIMAIEKALAIAAERELDLVEIVPSIHPPVCKILDYGKYLYHQKKIEQKQRKSQKKHEVKGIRLSLRTDQHDLEVKARRAQQFLEKGHSLKVALIFKGREIVHADLGFKKMIEFKKMLKEAAKVDQEPKRQGYNLFMILSPLK